MKEGDPHFTVSLFHDRWCLTVSYGREPLIFSSLSRLKLFSSTI